MAPRTKKATAAEQDDAATAKATQEEAEAAREEADAEDAGAGAHVVLHPFIHNGRHYEPEEEVVFGPEDDPEEIAAHVRRGVIHPKGKGAGPALIRAHEARERARHSPGNPGAPLR